MLPAPATTFGGIDSAQAAANAAVAALGVANVSRPTTTLRLNNMLTSSDLQDEPGLGDIEEETKVKYLMILAYTEKYAHTMVVHSSVPSVSHTYIHVPSSQP